MHKKGFKSQWLFNHGGQILDRLEVKQRATCKQFITFYLSYAHLTNVHENIFYVHIWNYYKQ